MTEQGPGYHCEEGAGSQGRGGACSAAVGRELAPGRAGRASLFELPLLPAHGAVLLHLLRVQPLEDAVHVETV